MSNVLRKEHKFSERFLSSSAELNLLAIGAWMLIREQESLEKY